MDRGDFRLEHSIAFMFFFTNDSHLMTVLGGCFVKVCPLQGAKHQDGIY